MNTSNFLTPNSVNRFDPFANKPVRDKLSQPPREKNDFFSEKLEQKQNDFNNAKELRNREDRNRNERSRLENQDNDARVDEKKRLDERVKSEQHDQQVKDLRANARTMNDAQQRGDDQRSLVSEASEEEGDMDADPTLISEDQTELSEEVITNLNGMTPDESEITNNAQLASNPTEVDQVDESAAKGDALVGSEKIGQSPVSMTEQNKEKKLSQQADQAVVVENKETIDAQSAKSNASKIEDAVIKEQGLVDEKVQSSKEDSLLRDQDFADDAASKQRDQLRQNELEANQGRQEEKVVTKSDDVDQVNQQNKVSNTDISVDKKYEGAAPFDQNKFQQGMPEKSLRQTMTEGISGKDEKKELRKMIRLERTLEQVRVENMSTPKHPSQTSLLSIGSLFKKVSDGIGDALNKVNLMNLKHTSDSPQQILSDRFSSVEKFSTHTQASISNDSPEGLFKERTAYSELREQMAPRIGLANAPLAERNLQDQRSAAKGEGQRLDVATQSSQQQSNSSADQQSQDFDQSGNQFFSQTSTAHSVVQAAVVDELQKKLAPEIIKQIERIRKSEQSWMRLAMDDVAEESVTLHLRLVNDQVTVRFSDQSESFKSAVQEMWSGLQETAQELGVDLTTPQFTQTQNS